MVSETVSAMVDNRFVSQRSLRIHTLEDAFGMRSGRQGKVRRFLTGYWNIMFHGETPSMVASWVIIACIIAIISSIAWTASPNAPRHVDTSEFVKQVENKNIEELSISLTDGSVAGKFKHPVNGVISFDSMAPTHSEEFIKVYMQDGDVPYDYTKPSAIVTTLLSMASTLLPIVVMLGAMWYLLKDDPTFANGPGKQEDDPFAGSIETVTFDDVCGVPEALEEVSELVTFIRDRDKYDKAGADTPKGILIQGPPGDGKTLLAKALAGEAHVPFFATSGSDFVEMYVGIGAKRIRSLFDKARENQPCIIFIDEIDAIGGNRDSNMGGGYTEEHLQTMNQLLTEMDGFGSGDRIIVVAATNRGDKLDPALLRPGRFDRIITVDNPAKEGRKEILKHYAIGRPFAERVDFDRLATHTYGFSGAQLESVMNQAATLAARRAIADGTDPLITVDDLDEGIARVISGPAMTSRRMTDEERRQVAYHEAGHAVVQYVLPNCDNVQKISLVSRNVSGVGAAMGYVQTYSEDDRYILTSAKCLDEMAALLAGRCAERMFCGIETTGASNDFEKASRLAYEMASEYAFDANDVAKDGAELPDAILRTNVMGRNGLALSGQKRLNDIDERAEALLQGQFNVTRDILRKHSDDVERLVTVLIDREQIDGSEIDDIIGGGK